MKWACAIGAVAGGAAAFGVYQRAIRPEMNRLGSTMDELVMSLPLDERVPHPRFVQQLAVTIEATPAEIWPWIVQLGEPPRAGYYSFTFIEKLVGLDVVNREEILPEFQHLRVGEAIDKNGTMVVQAVEPERYLVLGPPASVEDVQATWTFFLHPVDARSTRFITRCRAQWDLKATLSNAGPFVWATTALIEPGAFIMSWKMLRTIKELAEKRAA
jgi:hypothetical protein